MLTLLIFIDVDALDYRHKVAATLRAVDIPAQTIAEGFIVCNISEENEYLSYTSCTNNVSMGLSTPSSSFANFVATWYTIAQEILSDLKNYIGELSHTDKLYIVRKIVSSAIKLRTEQSQ